MARIIAWSPDVRKNQFTCYSSSRSALELYAINENLDDGSRSASLIAQRAVTNLVCMEWSKAIGGVNSGIYYPAYHENYAYNDSCDSPDKRGRGGDVGIDCNNLSSFDAMSTAVSSYTNQIVWGNAAGCVTLVDWNNANNECIICAAPSKGGRRSTTSISWNGHYHHYDRVAAGFDLLKNEYCLHIWDVNSAELLQTGHDVGLKPLVKLCFEEATASLAWLPDNPHLLAVGTAMGWVRVFDTRQSSSVNTTLPTNQNNDSSTAVSSSNSGAAISLEMSIMAHPGARNRKVKGIRPDPFHPHLIGTFSDSVSSPSLYFVHIPTSVFF